MEQRTFDDLGASAWDIPCSLQSTCQGIWYCGVESDSGGYIPITFETWVMHAMPHKWKDDPSN